MDWLAGGPLEAAGEVVFTTPEWQVWLVGTIAGLIWLLAARGVRSTRARSAELAAWALALTGLVMALAGPVWLVASGRMESGRLVVLVDGSRSMSVLEDGLARHEAVQEVVDHVRGESDRVDVFHFGDDLGVGVPESYDLPGTDFEGALQALEERVAGERLAGIVVISDGLDRGLLRQRFELDGADARAPDLSGPLTVFQVGTRSDLRDLSVRSVDAGGYAFIRSPFRVSATIEGVGFAGESVPVTLEKNGGVVTTRNVQLDADGHAEVSFSVTPEEAGRFAYAVTVPVFEGDAVPDNNSLPIVVSVVRDRIRVLQVAGSPSWDVKFLRRFLKGDPSVQLVSFFIMRTFRDMGSGYDNNELSLISFPYQQLFDEELSSFDVVVFQNFDYAPYFERGSQRLLTNIVDYVKAGGGFVMTGGDRSFGLGGYAKSPLAEILPVRLAPEGTEPDISPFLPVLTGAGARHPITRLTPDMAENNAWWQRLRPLDGTNVVQAPMEDAAVLLSHPTLRSDADAPLPILTAREVGAGRTLALTADSSWRWSLSEAAEGRGNQAYLRFWKNSLRWLMRDPSVSRVTVETARENYAVGDEVRVVVRVRDPGFAALPAADVATEVVVDGVSTTLSGATGSDGDLTLTVPAERRGIHEVAVVARVGGEMIGEAQTVFAVTSRDPELDEVAPDQAFLSWLTARVGGTLHAPGTLGEVTLDPEAGRWVDQRSETPLWRSPGLLGWILTWTGLAWVIRRRSGLA